jgi:hypothetical protein
MRYWVLALVLVALVSSLGCAAGSASAVREPVRIRLLGSEAPRMQLPAEAPASNGAGSPGEVGAPEFTRAPRIGAPGGSGAGSRRVLPAQSGKETVGGLPGGSGAGAGVTAGVRG